ncbi:MAG: TerC family protein [Candidatus Paracaedibacteraceae bacterium]|nr:TerC family protein [Candidatus Paracaedibacteraceae bacterium]
MELLSFIWMGKPLWIWAVFIILIFGLMVFDLGVLHRKQKEIKISESLWLSLFYVTMGLTYGAWIWFYMGETSASEYLTGYLVEKTLSLDNIFVMSLIFNYFGIAQKYQHRVLFWGILGVVLLRGLMIALGATLIERFEWVTFIFAGFLIVTGIKMLVVQNSEPELASNPILRWMQRHLRITPKLHGEKFFLRLETSSSSKKQLWLTPLFLALILIELADIVFAVDSIPAIFTITQDPYIVYTSNIFAVLGLRALYFALAAIIHRFHYLKYSLAIVLIFIGSKPFLTWWLGVEKFPASISLIITIALILSGILVSLLKTHSSIDGKK